MLDFLGTKGIWDREDPEKLLKKVREINNAIEQLVAGGDRHFADFEGVGRMPKAPTSTVRFLSDTIVIAFGSEDYGQNNASLLDAAMLYPVAFGCLFAQAAAAGHSAPALNLRGAIAVGQYCVSGNYLLGPAIDTAATHMEDADAAVVVVAPGETEVAWHCVNESRVSSDWRVAALGVETSIPVKVIRDGRIVRTSRPGIFINPYATCEDSDGLYDIVHPMKRAFGNIESEDVRRKRDNTLALHEEAAQRWRSLRGQSLGN